MVEKLTHPVTVKFCERGITTVQALSAARGMEMSEYIRDLVNQDVERARQQFDALKVIFGDRDLFDKGNEV